MPFNETLALCAPTIGYWRRQALAMGLDADDVEQKLTIKVHDIVSRKPRLRVPVPVYFKTVARNLVLDMQRSGARHAARTMPLEGHAEIGGQSEHKLLADVEFQADLERASLSRDAVRLIQIILANGGRAARPAFGDKAGHRRFYRARDEIRQFLERRRLDAKGT